MEGLEKIYGRIGEAKHKTGEASVSILKRMNSQIKRSDL
jgi:hypothetical protein